MQTAYELLQHAFPDLETNVLLNKFSTFRIGGPADLFYRAKEREKFVDLIRQAHQFNVPIYVTGGGSNVLFPDEGFRGLVIRVEFNKYRIEDNLIHAEAGVLLAMLVKVAYDNHLSGLANWTGLPGTVGGAVYGNAGAYGREVKDVLHHAIILNADDQVQEVVPDYFQFTYRHSHLKKKQDFLLEATFQLHQATPEELAQEKEATLTKRQLSQPGGFNVGSFFKNPKEQTDKSAGYLIEHAGLKGFQQGGAKISDKHANFLLNTGAATASDVILLADLVKKTVKEKFNIELHEEVQIVRNI